MSSAVPAASRLDPEPGGARVYDQLHLLAWSAHFDVDKELHVLEVLQGPRCEVFIVVLLGEQIQCVFAFLVAQIQVEAVLESKLVGGFSLDFHWVNLVVSLRVFQESSC